MSRNRIWIIAAVVALVALVGLLNLGGNMGRDAGDANPPPHAIQQ